MTNWQQLGAACRRVWGTARKAFCGRGSSGQGHLRMYHDLIMIISDIRYIIQTILNPNQNEVPVSNVIFVSWLSDFIVTMSFQGYVQFQVSSWFSNWLRGLKSNLSQCSRTLSWSRWSPGVVRGGRGGCHRAPWRCCWSRGGCEGQCKGCNNHHHHLHHQHQSHHHNHQHDYHDHHMILTYDDHDNRDRCSWWR